MEGILRVVCEDEVSAWALLSGYLLYLVFCARPSIYDEYEMAMDLGNVSQAARGSESHSIRILVPAFNNVSIYSVHTQMKHPAGYTSTLNTYMLVQPFSQLHSTVRSLQNAKSKNTPTSWPSLHICLARV